MIPSNSLTSPSARDSLSFIGGWTMWGKIEEYEPRKWRARGTWNKKRETFYKYFGVALRSEDLAKQLQERISAEIFNKTFDPRRYRKNNTLSFSNAADDWYKTTTCGEEWKEARKRIIERDLKPFFGSMDIRDIRSINILEFHSHLKDSGKSDKTIYNVMGELRAMLRTFSDDLAKIPSFPKLNYQVPGIRKLTYEQQEQVFEFIPEADKPIFQFWRHTGCRPNEARGQLRENIFPKLGYGIISTVGGMRANEIRQSTKTKRVKVFAITPEIEDALKPKHLGKLAFMHFDLRHKRLKPYSKSILWRIWTKANEQANEKYGVPIINPYNAFRHSFGCQRLAEGKPIGAVQQMYGHSSIKTTQRYAEYDIEKIGELMRPKLVRNGQGQKAETSND